MPAAILYPVFFVSGFAALVYQLVWQRALFTLLGIDTVSVSLIVAAFLLGLGVGALLGGALSKRRLNLALVFATLELGVGAFGLVSLPFFRWLASWTTSASGADVGLVAFAAVCVPTTLMGATLPILVQHRASQTANVGRSVGALYFVNTIGSAAGCAACALVIFGALGLSGSVYVAAAGNAFAAAVALVFVLARRRARRAP
jgi:predicted membrane-bound spermidine synthase